MDKRKRLFPSLTASVLITILALSSCSLPTATVVPVVLPTPTLGTVTVDTPITPSAEISDTPALVETATEEVASVPTFTASPGSTPTAAADCYRAEFVADVTYIDNSAVNANEEITKTWQVKNTGSCTWDAGYKLVFIRGEQMNGPSPADVISSPVAPGGSVELSIPMKAPAINGTHWGVWQLYNPAGNPVLKADGTPQELSIQINITNGQGGKVTSIHGWTYTYVGGKCTADVQYDISTSIYADGPVNVSYTWTTTNGQLTVVSQNYVFSNPGNVNVTTHISPPFANPNNIRVTLTANGVSSSFTICP